MSFAPKKNVKKSQLHQWRRRIGILLLGIVALGTLSVVVAWLWARPATPDAFYTPPETLPSAHGTLIRSEPYTGTLPNNATAWKILYTTTQDDLKPGVASAVVVIPTQTGDTALPIITWAHGTTGFARGCAPSLTQPYPSTSALPLLNEALTNGWAWVGTDYMGQGTPGMQPFLVGDAEAYSVLDATLAAQQLAEAHLSNQTVVWGHSQGGNAALWTGMIAPFYAPNLDILGVAAMAPASDLPAIVNAVKDTTAGKIIGSFVVSAYSGIYDDVHFDEIITAEARLLTRDMASRCVDGDAALFSVVEADLLPDDIFATDPTTGPLGERLTENIPNGGIAPPLMIAQGLSDTLIIPSVQATFVQQRCANNQSLTYNTYAGRNHLSLIAADSPLLPTLSQWTQARFAGTLSPSGCQTVQQ